MEQWNNETIGNGQSTLGQVFFISTLNTQYPVRNTQK